MISVALQYLKRGFPVIPVRPDKKPYIQWAEFQDRCPTEDEIRAWWQEHPKAMIGLVTGKISGLAVIDIDTQEGKERMNEILPDNFLAPTARTPRGGEHYYCIYQDGLSNNAGAVPGVDLRAEGGYIIAPPSRNGTGGSYRWLEGLSLDDCAMPSMPHAYITYLNNSIKYKGTCNSVTKRYETLQDVTVKLIQGQRDESLFHIANCLIKGGMTESNTRYLLDILADNCNPPFDKFEAQIKINSVLERAKRRERNFQKEVEEWISVTDGYWSVTDCNQALQCVTKEEKNAVRVAIHRLRKAGIIEKHGIKDGQYRRVDTDCEVIDFLNASDTAHTVKWPSRIEDLVQIMPGNIIVVAGEPNSGKTAFLLNLTHLNMLKFEVYYFSSEMGSLELRKRLSKFDIPLTDWKFHPMERTSNFADVIRPNAINIIDFLEVYEEFFKIGGMIKEIYDKLDKGIAVIAIQKNKNTEYGLGGMRGLEKARLYLTMEPNKIRIVKAKNWVASSYNPNGLVLDFRLVNGCQFLTDKEWYRP